jgi:hypothetical protein
MNKNPNLNNESVFDTLDTLYTNVDNKTTELINWYHTQKKSKKAGSLTLRFVAIIFTSIGGLIPIIAAAKQDIDLFGLPFSQFGYICLAIAAAAIGFDKFFGFSSSWMRFMKTSLVLEKELQDFQLVWSLLHFKVKNIDTSPELIEEMINRLREFSYLVNSKVEEETQQWISEFQSNLIILEGTSNKKKQRSRSE